MLRSHLFRAIALTATLTASALAAPSTAQAGCLTENADCSRCAEQSLWEGLKSMSASQIIRANLELYDCSIDLYHCILYGRNHSYPCGL